MATNVFDVIHYKSSVPLNYKKFVGSDLGNGKKHSILDRLNVFGKEHYLTISQKSLLKLIDIDEILEMIFGEKKQVEDDSFLNDMKLFCFTRFDNSIHDIGTLVYTVQSLQNKFLVLCDTKLTPEVHVYMFPLFDFDMEKDGNELIRAKNIINTHLYKNIDPGSYTVNFVYKTRNLSENKQKEVDRFDTDNGIEADSKLSYSLFLGFFMALQLYLTIKILNIHSVRNFFVLMHRYLEKGPYAPHVNSVITLRNFLIVVRGEKHRFKDLMPLFIKEKLLTKLPTYVADATLNWKWTYSRDHQYGIEIKSKYVRDYLNSKKAFTKSAWEKSKIPVLTTNHYVRGKTPGELFIPNPLTDHSKLETPESLIMDAIYTLQNFAMKVQPHECISLPLWLHENDTVVEKSNEKSPIVNFRRWELDKEDIKGRYVIMIEDNLLKNELERGTTTFSIREWDRFKVKNISQFHRISTRKGVFKPILYDFEDVQVIQREHIPKIDEYLKNVTSVSTKGWMAFGINEDEINDNMCYVQNKTIIVHSSIQAAHLYLKEKFKSVIFISVTVYGSEGITYSSSFNEGGKVLYVYHPLFVYAEKMCTIYDLHLRTSSYSKTKTRLGKNTKPVPFDLS